MKKLEFTYKLYKTENGKIGIFKNIGQTDLNTTIGDFLYTISSGVKSPLIFNCPKCHNDFILDDWIKKENKNIS